MKKEENKEHIMFAFFKTKNSLAFHQKKFQINQEKSLNYPKYNLRLDAQQPLFPLYFSSLSSFPLEEKCMHIAFGENLGDQRAKDLLARVLSYLLLSDLWWKSGLLFPSISTYNWQEWYSVPKCSTSTKRLSTWRINCESHKQNHSKSWKIFSNWVGLGIYSL